MEYLTIMDDTKYGGLDFSVSGSIGNFTQEQIKEFRSMCVVAIREADNMWMREHEKLHGVSQATPVKEKD